MRRRSARRLELVAADALARLLPQALEALAVGHRRHARRIHREEDDVGALHHLREGRHREGLPLQEVDALAKVCDLGLRRSEVRGRKAFMMLLLFEASSRAGCRARVHGSSCFRATGSRSSGGERRSGSPGPHARHAHGAPELHGGVPDGGEPDAAPRDIRDRLHAGDARGEDRALDLLARAGREPGGARSCGEPCQSTPAPSSTTSISTLASSSRA